MKLSFLNRAAEDMSKTSHDSAEVKHLRNTDHKQILRTNRTKKDRQDHVNAYDDVVVGMYPESDILDEQVDTDNYQMQVIENNKDRRIIILKDESGHARYKSIYNKADHMLEMFDPDQGLVFKGVIDI